MIQDPLRIGFFTNMYRPFVGGVTRSIETFTHDLRKLGHHVYIFAPTFDDQEEETNVIRLPAIPKAGNTNFSFPLPMNMKVRLHFENLNLNVVHVHHPFLLGELGLDLAKKAGLPIVFTHHTRYEDYAHYVPLERDVAERMLVGMTVDFCNQCDLVIAPSESVKKLILDRGVTSEIAVVPTGINTEAYGEVDRDAVRKEIGIPDGAPFIFHAGRLAKEKNLSILLQAFKLIVDEVPDAILAIAGSGPEEEILKQEAVELGINDSIRWLSSMTGEQLIAPYSAADLFLFASTSETQGLVVAEAMAGGTAVVAVDASGTRDIVREGVDGFLTENTAESLAKAAIELLKNPVRLHDFGVAARERSLEFDRAVCAKKLATQYERLAQLPREELNQEVFYFEKARRLFLSLIES